MTQLDWPPAPVLPPVSKRPFEYTTKLTRAEAEAAVKEWTPYSRRMAYRMWNRHGGILDEFRLAALEALWESALRFEVDRGWKFCTYATFWIRKNLQDLVRLSTGMPRSQYATHRYQHIATMSLDAEYMGTGNRLVDIIPAREEAERTDFPTDFWNRVNKWLDPRSQEVIRLRFREGLTLEDVGNRIGLTRERIRQLEAKALRKVAARADFASRAEWV